MIDDLITRLTWVAADDVANCGAIRHEAAAEIRRLRDQLAIAERALEQLADQELPFGSPTAANYAQEALDEIRQRKAVE